MSKILKVFLFLLAGVAVSFSFDVSRLKNIDGKAPPQKRKNVSVNPDLDINDTPKKLTISKNRDENKKQTKKNNLEKSQADAQATAAILNSILEKYIQAKQKKGNLLPLQSLARQFMQTYNNKIDDPIVIDAEIGKNSGFGGQKHIQTINETMKILENLSSSGDTVIIRVKEADFLGSTEGKSSGLGLVYEACGATSGEPLTPIVNPDRQKINSARSHVATVNAEKVSGKRQKIRGQILSGKKPCPEKLTDAIFMSGLHKTMRLGFKQAGVINVFSTPASTQDFLKTAQENGFLTVVDGKKGFVVARIKELESDSFQEKQKGEGRRVVRSCSYTVPQIAEFYQNEGQGPASSKTASQTKKGGILNRLRGKSKN